jgi:hypothetical protein
VQLARILRSGRERYVNHRPLSLGIVTLSLAKIPSGLSFQ